MAKTYSNILKEKFLNKMPKGWKEIKGAQTAPKGYVWISNGKSIFDRNYQSGLIPIKEYIRKQNIFKSALGGEG